MGEAKRRKDLGLKSKKGQQDKIVNSSPRLIKWLPVTQNQKDKFIQLSIRASWVGIGLLVLLWLVVRFIGPALGWWTTADSL